MLLCEGGKEGCHAACHTYCCSPPLTQIPASETGSVRGVHEWPHLGRPTRACVTMACTAVPSGDQPAMALRRPSGSREDVTTTAVVAEAVEARETRAVAEVLARVVGVAYYVVEDRVYPCYVFEAMGEESQAKLDNDLGKIKTELQKAARAVDASLVVSLEHMQQHLAVAAAADALAASARAIAAFIKKKE